jgi:hypothetical protein
VRNLGILSRPRWFVALLAVATSLALALSAVQQWEVS